jgi:hypothetical protein
VPRYHGAKRAIHHESVGLQQDESDLFVLGDAEAARRPGRRDIRRTAVLNKFGPSGLGEAQVQYLDGDFRVISPGTYVRCAVTGVQIPLDDLKYWSVDRKEAYATASAVLQRHYPDAMKPKG